MEQEFELECSFMKKHVISVDNVDDYLSDIISCGCNNKVREIVECLRSEYEHHGLYAFSFVFQEKFVEFLSLDVLKVFINYLLSCARKEITNSVFKLSFFVCVFCESAMNDPVTLKCGHTFSKKCILQKSERSPFNCIKCGKAYTHSYIDELKPNIVISSFIDSFWKNLQYKESFDHNETPCDFIRSQFFFVQETSPFVTYRTFDQFLHTPSAKDLHQKAKLLVKIARFKEASQMYLFSSALDPSVKEPKATLLELLHQHLQKCLEMPKTYKSLSYTWVNPIEKRNFYLLIYNFCRDIKRLSGEEFSKNERDLCFDQQNFECSLCLRIFLEPITTPCGHTFCRICLYRSFDHQPLCPLCKRNLNKCLAERVTSMDKYTNFVCANLYPEDFDSRKATHFKEMELLFNAGKDPNHEIPLFVCTIAFPNMRCPLHVFEPRYRYMLRLCIESRCYKFGMCAAFNDNIISYGTVVNINEVRYFPDGRSVVDTVGNRRFHILKTSESDGYLTGNIEYLQDEILTGESLKELEDQHNKLYEISQTWVSSLPNETILRVMQHFGPMPEVEPDCFSKPDGPSWFWWILAILPIETRFKASILSKTSVLERLNTLERLLEHVNNI